MSIKTSINMSPSTIDNLDTRFVHALEAFLAPNASLPAEKEHLLVYLTRPPPREPVLDTVQTVEDMAQRVEFAKNIEANTGLLKYKFTVVEASAILSLPQAALRAMEGDCPEVTPNQFFANFRELLFSFTQVPLRDVANNTKVLRNKQQADLCRQRDSGRCIFLHTSSPKVCHIFPFSANASDRNMRRLSSSERALRCIVGDEGIRLLTTSLGCSDKAWNMLSLGPQLHRWWSHGRFALKCLGVMPVVDQAQSRTQSRMENQAGDADVTVQFHWIPRRVQEETTGRETHRETHRERDIKTDTEAAVARRRLDKAYDRVDGFVRLEEGDAEALWTDWVDRVRASSAAECLDDVVGRVATSVPGSDSGCVAAAIPETGRLLLTGTTAKIRMPVLDAYKMQTMINLQWSLTKVATMSDAAEFAELLRRYGKYEDDFFDSDGEQCFEEGSGDEYGFDWAGY